MDKFRCDMEFTTADLVSQLRVGYSDEQAIVKFAELMCKKNNVPVDLEAVRKAYQTERQGSLVFSACDIRFEVRFNMADETTSDKLMVV